MLGRGSHDAATFGEGAGRRHDSGDRDATGLGGQVGARHSGDQAATGLGSEAGHGVSVHPLKGIGPLDVDMLARDITHDDSGGGQDGDATGGYDSSGGDDDDDNDNDDNDPALTGGGSSGIAGDARSRGRSDTTTVGDGADHGGGGGGGGGTVPSAADATRSFSSPKQRQAWLRNIQKRQKKQAAKTRQRPDS